MLFDECTMNDEFTTLLDYRFSYDFKVFLYTNIKKLQLWFHSYLFCNFCFVLLSLASNIFQSNFLATCISKTDLCHFDCLCVEYEKCILIKLSVTFACATVQMPQCIMS